jgi:hypothetical protein
MMVEVIASCGPLPGWRAVDDQKIKRPACLGCQRDSVAALMAGQTIILHKGHEKSSYAAAALKYGRSQFELVSPGKIGINRSRDSSTSGNK